MLKELPEVDFSSDNELLRIHRGEIKANREKKRLEQRKKRLLENAQKNKTEQN